MSDKKYTLVYEQGEFNGRDFQIAYDTLDNLKTFVANKGLPTGCYTVIDGFPVKTFVDKQWPSE
jgi:hypothetical protein